jgi:hypothetical protein
MQSLPLYVNGDLRSSRSDFGAKVDHDRLELPEVLAPTLRRRKLRTANQWLNLLFTFPSEVAADLGWGVTEVVEARGKLVHQLTGFVPDAFLRPDVPTFGTGARNPHAVGRHPLPGSR